MDVRDGFVGAIGLSELETLLSGTFVSLWLLIVGILLTPTGSCLGELDPAHLSLLDARAGALVSGDPPTKEAALHLAMYGERLRDPLTPERGAVGIELLRCKLDGGRTDDPRVTTPSRSADLEPAPGLDRIAFGERDPSELREPGVAERPS